MKALSLKINVGWSLLGTCAYSALNWAMNIALAKLGSPSIVGKYALGVAVTQPIFAFFQMQLRSIQATDAKDEFRFQDYFILRLLFMGLAFAVTGMFAFPGNPIDTAFVILLTGLGLVLDSISDVIYGLQQKHHRLDFLGKSMVAKGVLNFVLISGCFYLTRNIVIAMIASVVASAIVVFFYDLVMARNVLKASASAGDATADGFFPSAGQKVDWPALRRLIITALPLGITLMFGALNGNVTRYVLNHFLGEHALGVFATLSSLVVIARTIVIAFGNAINSRLAESFKRGNIKQFERDMLRFALFCILLGGVVPLVAWIGGPKLIAAVFTKDYSHDFKAMILVLVAGGVSYLVSCLGYGITAAGMYRVQVGWTAVSVVVAGVAAWILVPRFGLLGAADAVLLSQVVQAAIGVVILLRAIDDGTDADPGEGADRANVGGVKTEAMGVGSNV